MKIATYQTFDCDSLLTPRIDLDLCGVFSASFPSRWRVFTY